MTSIIFPFQYTYKSKRGNDNHLLNVVIAQDLAISLLVYGFSVGQNVKDFLALFLLIISFWSVYEIGYFENDLHELKFETIHKNTDKIRYVKQVQNDPVELALWTWSLMIGALGIVFLQDAICFQQSCLLLLAINLIKWIAWLSIVRIAFRIYNFSTVKVRQQVFLLLQILRLTGPLLFFRANLIGIFLIVSQVVSRWIGYLVYRSGGDERLSQKRLARHFIFVMLVVGMAIVQHNPFILLSWQVFLSLLWSLMQGHLKWIVNQSFTKLNEGACIK